MAKIGSAARTALVEFRTGKKKPVYGERRYTYLLPPDVDVAEGDVIVVPVGDYGHTRRATVVHVGQIEYKYAIGKLVTF